MTLRRKPAKTKVSCSGLVNKAIEEAQKMVDGFKGHGVWGELVPPKDADAYMEFGYSGMLPTDDEDGWDDGVAKRLSGTDCEHVW